MHVYIPTVNRVTVDTAEHPICGVGIELLVLIPRSGISGS